MAISHIKALTMGDGTDTNVVRPSDWMSAHNMIQNIGGNTIGTSQVSGTDIVWAGGNNITLSANGATISIVNNQFLTIAGNTAGASTVSGTAPIVWAGGNGITLSINGGTISIIGPAGGTESSYVPFEAAGLASASVAVLQGTSGVVSFWPVTIPNWLAVDRINLVLSMNPISSTISGRQTAAVFFGLFTRGTGASTSIISQLDSVSLGWSVTNSSGSFTISQATATNSVGYTYNTLSNNASATAWSGLKLVQMPIGTTLSPGVYWIGMIGTQSTTSANVGLGASMVGVSMTLTNLAPMGSASSAFSSGNNQTINNGQGEWLYAQGQWSTAGGNNLPASAGITAIVNGASVMPFMKFWSTT